MVLARTSDSIPFRAPRRSGEGPWIAAHRGHSARFPENTIAAFEGAVAAGADLIETDIQRARDGVFVCLHDPDLGRLAGNTAKVADLDAADLDAILGRRTAGGVPRLSQVLEFARGRIGLLLDLKSTEARFVGAVARAVRDAGVSARATVCSGPDAIRRSPLNAVYTSAVASLILRTGKANQRYLYPGINIESNTTRVVIVDVHPAEEGDASEEAPVVQRGSVSQELSPSRQGCKEMLDLGRV